MWRLPTLRKTRTGRAQPSLCRLCPSARPLPGAWCRETSRDLPTRDREQMQPWEEEQVTAVLSPS